MQFMYNIHIIICHCFLINIGISTAYLYFHWYFKKSNIGVNTSVNTETVIY